MYSYTKCKHADDTFSMYVVRAGQAPELGISQSQRMA